jgi:HAE1 family hydrophobic/amphiphilic exporter-1
MAYLIVVVLGAAGLRYLPVDLLPAIELARLAVFVNYPNVGPEEIESIITDPLENALSGVPNLERMTSRSEEGRSRVSLQFARGTKVDEAANDVRGALDRLRDDLPLEAEPPGIWKFDPDAQEIVTLTATSTRDLEKLTRMLEREIAQRFKQVPAVGAVNVDGGIYREIQVRLRRDRLRAAGLAPGEVAEALGRENVQLPGGDVKAGVQDLYVRTKGEFASLASTVVALREGDPVRVRDIAEVVDGYEDLQDLAEHDGVPVVRVGIQKQSGSNTVSVARAVREEAARINEDRDDVELAVVADQSEFIRQSMDNVRGSALWGGLLAILIFYVFLRNGFTTFIISLSIPVSIIATFGLLYFTGLTLNQMTFGGLALGIGLIVDNSIVVLENIVRHREREGKSLAGSAAVGTREVAGAIVASTLTTCVIFLPVVFMRTTSGQLFQTLALVVVFALACSLLAALTLVPMLASRILSIRPAPGPDSGERSARRPSRLARFFRALEDRYAVWLGRTLAHRGKVYLAAALLVLGALALWPLVPVELAPQVDANEIDIEMEMAQGTNLAVAKAYLDELERLVRPLLPEEDLESVSTEVRPDGDAEVEVRLLPAGIRKSDPSELADRLREAVAGKIPGAEVEVDAQSGLWMLRRLFSAGGGDEDVEMQLRGYDLELSRALAREIKARAERTPGVVGVRIGRQEGRPEENLIFNRDRIHDLGLSVREVAMAVQTSVGGSRAGYFREEGQQFPVVVRLRPEDRLTAQDLDAVSVKTPEGRMVPISELVRREGGRGPMEIRHVDGQRVTYITANLESGVPLGEAVERIRENLRSLSMPQDFSVVFGGAYREQIKARRDFLVAILLALVLVYMVMAAQFERFLDPLVVMFSVPAALVGVIPTLLLTGTTLNVQSVMGLVMLIGIVVNNAIVLVDYINLRRREAGMDVLPATVEAARLRLRPILMTTATTVLGMFPLALGLGAGASLQASLARVVVGGLLASSLITLVLIPSVYVGATLASDRLRKRLRRARPAPAATPA